jgi:hypothetical protein
LDRSRKNIPGDGAFATAAFEPIPGYNPGDVASAPGSADIIDATAPDAASPFGDFTILAILRQAISC